MGAPHQLCLRKEKRKKKKNRACMLRVKLDEIHKRPETKSRRMTVQEIRNIFI